MKIEVEYWDIRNNKSVPIEVENWNGNKEGIFKKFYKENNSLRYCNGSYYKFKDDLLEKEYMKWLNNLPESVRFQMYYGNGVVD